MAWSRSPALMTMSMRARSIFRFCVLSAASLILAGGPGPVLAAERVASGLLADGTSYLITIPDNWNGVVISDLDYVTSADGARSRYFLSKGFGLSGIGRHPQRRDQYDPAVEVDDLMAVLDMLKARFGAPKRIIQYGQSGGGHIALAIAETHPERVNGAIATCAHTPLLTAGARYDVMTALKALAAPGDATLMTAGFPRDVAPQVARWTEVLKAAGETPQGRARIALAFAVTQWPAWGVGEGTPPDPRDPQALAAIMARTAASLAADNIPSQYMYERHGALAGTVGADYAAYWANADPAYAGAVRSLYLAAGLDLQADLSALGAAPRTPNDPKADDFWQGVQTRTPRGLPLMPVLRMHTIGDPTTMVAQTKVYWDLVEKNGKGDLYRRAFVERTGHCNFTVAESAAAVAVMMRRLDTGHWEDMAPGNLNSIGRAAQTWTEPRFVDYVLRPFNGMWRLRRS